MNKKRQNTYKIAYMLGLIVFGVVYFFFLGENGPYLMRDSGSFINPTPGLLQSYWLYPRFLDLCENIWGSEMFLHGVFILQGILAILASICLTEFFSKYFNLGYLPSLLIYFFTLLPYGYSLPENVVTHHIMTEGLSISLFHFLLLFACKTFLEKKYNYMIFTIIFGALLVLSRSQLLVVVPAIALLVVIVIINEFIVKVADRLKIKRKVFITCLVMIVGSLLVILVLGVFTKTAIGSQLTAAVSGRVMCLMDYEDRELFSGEMQEIYDALYRNADEGGHTEAHFRTDSWRSYDIAEHTNENTKEGLLVIREFYAEKYPDKDSSEYSLKSYYDRDYIIQTLFLNHIVDYLVMSIQLMTQSFVASIFIQPDSIRNLCYFITFFIYLGTFVVLYIAKEKIVVDNKYIIPMWITLLFLFSNVVFTNIIFYGQQRYVIYTFGMFYISLFIMLVGIYRKRKESAESESTGKCNYSCI